MQNLNRREFVAAAAMAAAACLCVTCPATLLADDDDKSTTIDIGAKSDYTKEGITDTWIKSKNVVVVLHSSKLYAFTAVCTHKGGILQVSGDHLACPRHHANFSVEGKVTQGPAKKSLVRYAISVDDNSHVIVDKSKTFTDDQWTDANSFVTIDTKSN